MWSAQRKVEEHAIQSVSTPIPICRVCLNQIPACLSPPPLPQSFHSRPFPTYSPRGSQNHLSEREDHPTPRLKFSNPCEINKPTLLPTAYHKGLATLLPLSSLNKPGSFQVQGACSSLSLEHSPLPRDRAFFPFISQDVTHVREAFWYHPLISPQTPQYSLPPHPVHFLQFIRGDNQYLYW